MDKLKHIQKGEDHRHLHSRRALLRQLLGMGLGLPLAGFGRTLPQASGKPQSGAATRPAHMALSKDDDNFLEDLERASFAFFWEQASPQTGLVKDRCNVRGPDHSVVASIAATGFGLTAWCIGHKRGYISFSQAHGRVLASLRFLWKKLTNHRGFFFHFANMNTGERLWDSEVSSIDTAILLCGVLTCREYFRDYEIRRLAIDIFNRVDWRWLGEDTPLLSMGWMPEVGFLPYRWDDYSELMMMYLLGMGAYYHPLPERTWTSWKRVTFEYHGLRYIGSFAPLFVNQYSQAWFDFRGKRDQYADYFQNSVLATEAHRIFCMELAPQFPDYSNDLWGITASDSESHGYVVWGGPPKTGPIDGTIVPCAAGGSLAFLPDAALLVLRNIKTRYGKGAWSKYGFIDAFNPLTNWYDRDVVGIDTGITLLMAENLRTGFVWNTFMKNPEARRGMDRAGFKPYQPSSAPHTQQSAATVR
ncbi:MAG: glucoamylase family protein [Terriglobia bacterium]